MAINNERQPLPVDTLLEMLMAARVEMGRLREHAQNGTTLGRAEGIVMERLDLEAPQALAYLQRVSRYSGNPLADIAADILVTRDLPGISSDRLRLL